MNKKPGFLFKIILISVLLPAVILFHRVLTDPPLTSVQWLLYPTVILVSMATGLPFPWTEPLGYFNREGNIIINQSCSGLTFLAVLIIINTVLYISGTAPPGKTALRFLLLLFPAYLVTLVANAARVVCSLLINRLAGSLAWLNEGRHLAHLTCGIIIFFSFIILYHYLITRWTLWKKQPA